MIDSLAEIQFVKETKAHTTIFINKHSTIDSNLSIGMKTNEAQQIDNISFSSLRMASLYSVWVDLKICIEYICDIEHCALFSI